MNKKLLLATLALFSLTNLASPAENNSAGQQLPHQESAIGTPEWNSAVKLKAFQNLLKQAITDSEALIAAQNNGDTSAEDACYNSLRTSMERVIAAARKYAPDLLATGDAKNVAFAKQIIAIADAYEKRLQEIEAQYAHNAEHNNDDIA